jgi:hypothetical protein
VTKHLNYDFRANTKFKRDYKNLNVGTPYNLMTERVNYGIWECLFVRPLRMYSIKSTVFSSVLAEFTKARFYA